LTSLYPTLVFSVSSGMNLEGNHRTGKTFAAGSNSSKKHEVFVKESHICLFFLLGVHKEHSVRYNRYMDFKSCIKCQNYTFGR
jgi:hypothetical protein